MLEKYGLQSSVASGNYNIAREPLYFVRSGYVDLNTGALRNFGINGYDWSRIATVYGAGTWNAKAYNLNFNASGVNPSNNNVRWNGFPVRCLVILV